MGQRPRKLTPEAGPWHYLGAEMRAWRNQRGLSLAKLSKKILFNPSYMARAERGDQTPSADLVTAYDHALEASGALVRIYRRITEQPRQDPSARVHVSKTAAHVSNHHEPLETDTDAAGPSSTGITVPVRTDDGRIVFVSLSRRTLLGALGTAAVLSASPEAASAVAAPPAHPDATPIEHLEATRRVLIDNDNLFGPHQVIPVVQRQITAIKALREHARGADRARLLRLQTQYSELCGWLYQDAGDFRAAQHWTREALETSHLVGDPELTAYALARRSQLAGDMRDALEAVDVAEAAERMAPPGSRLTAVAATYSGLGHALQGDADASQRAYDHAQELRQSVDPDSPWGAWRDAAYIEVHRAHSLVLLGDYEGAAERFRTAIDKLPPRFHRDRGVYLAREAVALAGAGDHERAAHLGLQALHIGRETGSARITRALARLDSQLSRVHTVPSVQEFRQALDASLLHQAT